MSRLRENIAIDGKILRRSCNKGKRCGAIHMVPELLKILSLRGCLVTIDTTVFQKDIVEKIVAQDADYLLAVKGNQKRLVQAIGQVLNPSMLNSLKMINTSLKREGMTVHNTN